jgi:hypothetical protein
MSRVLTAAVVVTGLFAGGCEARCPPGTLAAGFAPDGVTGTVHGESPSWATGLSLSPPNDNGKAWTAAVENASAAPPSFGVIVFNSGTESLTLGLPFPLTTGQSLALTANQQAGVSSFQRLPAAAGPTIWLDPCVGAGPTTPTNCELTSGQMATGTLRVETSSPLRARLDAHVSGGPGSTSVVLAGEVTFEVVPESCSSSSSGFPPISG